MTCKKHELYQAYLRLLEIGGSCGASIAHECQAETMTPKQIYYLKIIDHNDDMTFSKLAHYTSNSKPTVTEMINRFIANGCVYKEKSANDKRVCYIHLTPKGKRIARAEEMTQIKLIERIESCLSEEEVSLLISLLNKLD